MATPTISTPNMPPLPSTMRAWQYTSTTPTLESNLTLRTSLPLPVFHPSDPSHRLLIRVISASLNPIDYKKPEIPLFGRFLIPRPAIPGSDFCGRIVRLSSPDITAFHINDLVFGRLDPTTNGTLAEYIAAPVTACAVLPPRVSPSLAAAMPTAGLTEYKAMQGAKLKSGDKVFINGGAGGTGTMGIQIAKAMGCHVTTSCSPGKVELCKRMGADEVVDYTKEDVVSVLEGQGRVFSVVVDNVGGMGGGLYRNAGRFLVPGGRFVQVGLPSGVKGVLVLVGRMVLSMWRLSGFGGGDGKFRMFDIKGAGEELVTLGEWMAEGRAKPHVEMMYEFERAPEAFAKLREGHCEGKLVVRVGDED